MTQESFSGSRYTAASLLLAVLGLTVTPAAGQLMLTSTDVTNYMKVGPGKSCFCCCSRVTRVAPEASKGQSMFVRGS